MLLTRRARLLAVPLGVLALVAASHQGYYAGSYRASRPDVEPRSHQVAAGLDGFLYVLDGIPTQVDAANGVRLTGLFQGRPAAECAGILDMRPVPACLAGAASPLLGRYWGAALVNALLAALAAACALDLARLWGRPPLVGVVFATLVVGSRGMAFYVGCPDAHALSLAWIPIGVWVCERCRVGEPDGPAWGLPAASLVIGLAALTHLADLSLLVWLGWRALPWQALRERRLRPDDRRALGRLLAVGVGVVAIVIGWRLVGRAAGLPFDSFTDRGIPDGLRGMWSEVHERVGTAWHPPVESGWRPWANAVIQALRRLPPWGIIIPVLHSLVPAFGYPLLVLGGAGWLLCARRGDRLRALGLLVPSCLVALPILYYWTAPRLLCMGWLGLAWPAALALVGVERAAWHALVRLGCPPQPAAWAGRALLLLGLGAVLLLENRDALGDMSIPIGLMWG